MAGEFHYPPDLLELLVETISRLSKGKAGVVLFLQGAGVALEDINDVAQIVRNDPASINKAEIVRQVLIKVNTRGDSGLRPRREIIRRVTEFENFDACWPNQKLEAKGLVASVRELVKTKDAFTRMKQERDLEREKMLSRQSAERAILAEKRLKIEGVGRRLAALFAMDDQPQKRGKELEGVLNDLFQVYGILVREDFHRRDSDANTVLEQIDGVIELGGEIHLVEMKWLKEPVGMADFSPHVSRIFTRANARGIFISTNGYTQAVLMDCKNALNLKTIFLCSLQEFVMLLQRQGDLIEFLKRKSQAAIIDKQPFLEILA